jgi:hypothetical protein
MGEVQVSLLEYLEWLGTDRSQDDCMIEIFFDSKRDSIGMEVSCKSSVLSESEASMLAEAWGREVVAAFRLPSAIA